MSADHQYDTELGRCVVCLFTSRAIDDIGLMYCPGTPEVQAAFIAGWKAAEMWPKLGRAATREILVQCADPDREDEQAREALEAYAAQWHNG